jgi:hypothetical protein
MFRNVYFHLTSVGLLIYEVVVCVLQAIVGAFGIAGLMGTQSPLEYGNTNIPPPHLH